MTDLTVNDYIYMLGEEYSRRRALETQVANLEAQLAGARESQGKLAERLAQHVKGDAAYGEG